MRALPTLIAAGSALLLCAAASATEVAPHGAAATAAPAATLTPPELRRQLAAMPRGDAERGERLYVLQFCASCHGAQGTTPSVNWPSVAGQRVAYTYKLLQDYQTGRRHEGERAALMRDAVVGLSDQDLADLAAYTARLPRPTSDAAPAATPKPIETLVRHGDRQRLLTACASCHGARGEGGTNAQPALAGQNPAYLVRTLLDYHGGTRANDPARGMRAFAAKLTPDEVDALAAYYAALPPRR
jgi:cytochrome c553